MVTFTRRLPQFAAVGALGFCVDAGLMLLLVHLQSWHPVAARCVSFPVALTFTWLVNRNWVFKTGYAGSSGAEYGRYVVIQGLGALVNVSIFLALITYSAGLQAAPVMALAIGAVCSLLLNYALLSVWVYQDTASVAHAENPTFPPFQYSGVGNLEVMNEAVRYQDFLVRLILQEAPEDPACVIDFGAGTGTFALAAKRSGLPVLSIEPDPALREGIIQAGGSALASLGEVPDESADYVYTLNVLEHINDDVATLREIRQALGSRGRLLIYVPAFMVLFGPMDRLVGHYRRYRLGDLSERLRQAGFEVERAEYVDSIGFFAALLYRFIGSNSGSLNPGSVRVYDKIFFPLSRHLDRLTRKAFGKNLLVVARRLDSSAR